jgi:hypothetical protein
MSEPERLKLIRRTLDDRKSYGSAPWGLEADLIWLLAAYDSVKACYDGLIERDASQTSARHEE